MKVAERVLETEGNLGGERVGMSIDQSALAHIMSVLTDLYSDPELAIIREYSTNALDANVEAGVTRPIEVTLPSPLSPFLRIRDHGIGLDAEGIRSIYSQYGTSTKRNSNDVVGMLGLGCKSALTYTDQFTLTSYKNGRCIQVSIGRDADGAGSMSIVADYESNDDNGTEIVIPTKRHNALEAKAHEFFSFWAPGTVLVNGEAPKRIDGMWIEDGKLLLTRSLSEGKVVMGNVAYPWPDAPKFGHGGYDYRTHTSRSRWHAVAFVPIGAVQFTPSREALQMTKLTRDKLAELTAEVNAKLDASLTTQIEKAPNAGEALRLYEEAESMGRTLNATYKGKAVVTSISRTVTPDNKSGILVAGMVDGSYRGTRVSGERRGAVNIRGQKVTAWFERRGAVNIRGQKVTAWFENFDAVELTPTKREKLAVFFAQKGKPNGYTRMVFLDTLDSDEKFWLTGQDVYDWADVDAIKLTRAERVTYSGRPKGSYKGRLPNGEYSEKIVADTIDTTKPIVWHNGNRTSMLAQYEFRAELIPADGLTLIYLEANRIEKFKRDFPGAVMLHEYAEKEVKTWLERLDKDDLAAAHLQRIHGTRLAGLDPSRIDDPALQESIKKQQNKKATALLPLLKRRERWVPHIEVKHPLADYPLLAPAADLRDKEHVYIYLNAAYAARKGKA